MDTYYKIVNLSENKITKLPIKNLDKFSNAKILECFDTCINKLNWSINDNIVAISETSYDISYKDLLVVNTWIN